MAQKKILGKEIINPKGILPRKGTRIAKWLAERTSFSRRKAEKLILQEKVRANGNLVKSPVFFMEGSEVLTIDGALVNDEKPKAELWCYHKKRGTIVSRSDPLGRPSVFDDFPETSEPWITVGRLDFNTEGLLLVTNSGDLAHGLARPQGFLKKNPQIPGSRTGRASKEQFEKKPEKKSCVWIRKYVVRVFGSLHDNTLSILKEGIMMDGINYKPYSVSILQKRSRNSWLEVELCEGKNREIHRLMERANLQVSRMIRVSFGDFLLGDLQPGAMKKIPQKKLKELFPDL